MGRFPHYSRGIRQRLYMLSKELNWKEKHNVLIGSRDIPVGVSFHQHRSGMFSYWSHHVNLMVLPCDSDGPTMCEADSPEDYA